MAAAGVGEDDGLPSTGSTAEAPGPTPDNSATQMLPMVRRDSSATDDQTVRAVARRVPSALPALGRDGAPEVPRSARATVDRRRQAAARAAGTPEPEPPAPPPPPPGPTRPSVSMFDPAQPTLVTTRVEAVDHAPPGPVLPAPALSAPAPPVPVSPAPPVAPAAKAVPSTNATDPPAGTGAAWPVVHAEIVDAPVVVAGRPVVGGAVAAEMVSALTEIAFRDARDDEWAVADPGAGDVDAAGIMAPVRPQPSAAPGPAVLEADSWDADSWDVVSEPTVERDYQGRRRAGAGGGRLWIVIGLVVVALGAAIGVPFLLTPGGAPAADHTPNGGLPPVLDDDGTVISGTSSPGETTAADPTTATGGGPAVAASPLVTATTTGRATSGAGNGGGNPAILTIEAEAPQNTVSGSASRSAYAGTSGGQLVGYIGKVDSRPAGVLSFNGVRVPTAGTYVVKFYYISNASRTALVSANGGANVSVTASTANNCCATREVRLTLDTRPGGNTITISNPTARAPAIDRIVITKA
jgi:hypothetical protein